MDGRKTGIFVSLNKKSYHIKRRVVAKTLELNFSSMEKITFDTIFHLKLYKFFILESIHMRQNIMSTFFRKYGFVQGLGQVTSLTPVLEPF